MQESPVINNINRQLPISKKSKLQIPNIHCKSVLDEIIEEGDIDETVIDYLQKVDDEYLVEMRRDTVENGFMSTNFTTKLSGDEKSDTCLIF
jgi:hypothetical protein